MRVKDLMTARPITIGRRTSVLEAECIMQKARVRHLIVIEDGHVVGIISDRDIRLTVPAPTAMAGK